MKARRTAAGGRGRRGLGLWGMACAAAALLLPGPGLAAPPRARSFAVTPLEEQLTLTPERESQAGRQPVLGYLHLTDKGWRLDLVPGAVPRNGPLPALTSGVDAAREDFTSHTVAPYAPVLRIDF